MKRILAALLLSLLGVPARADLLDDIPDCQVQDCELVYRPSRPIGLFLALLLAIFVGGCGASDPCPVEAQQWTDLGIGLYVEAGAAEWTHSPDLPERVDRVAKTVAAYAGTDSAPFVGIVLVLRDTATVSCGDLGPRNGCDHADQWIELGAGGEWANDQAVPLLGHEFLHVVIGDPDHLSPLWANLWIDALHGF
jgi:hypothetical protein